MNRWLLPEYIEDVLPQDAWHIEFARARLLDLFRRHGFELVIPPHIEYVESLTSVAGDDVDLKTFKLVDQLSGRLLGLRADMTPQVARIDAHLLNREDVTRLCYAGHVVHTLPVGHVSTREPLQVGAELYGAASLDADVEIVALMVQSLADVGVANAYIEIGHVGVFRALCAQAQADALTQAALFAALQLKDAPSIRALTADWDAQLQAGMVALPTLFGDASVLSLAREVLPALPTVVAALDDLAELLARLAARGITAGLDLAELRSGLYHNGVVFTAFAAGWSNPVARGGRYDGMGAAFGRARAATGFSLDLRDILRTLPSPAKAKAILAPAGESPALLAAIAELRAAGHTVRVDLTGAQHAELDYDRILLQVNDRWQVEALN